jgi:hypothetical protein
MFACSRNKIIITAVLAATWIAALGYGMRVLLKYETTPGSSGVVTARWPAESVVTRPSGKAILVMVAHPRCPCTRASIGELAEIMAHAPEGVKATVLFVKPTGAAADWDDTDLRRSAAAIPGVMVQTDENGIEAARFGVQTSGHTLVFDGEGKLVFSGGITGTRGHAGNNLGENAALTALRQEKPERAGTAIFGCSLVKRNSPAEEKL